MPPSYNAGIQQPKLVESFGRMLKRGFVMTHQGEPEEKRGGHSKRFYKITAIYYLQPNLLEGYNAKKSSELKH